MKANFDRSVTAVLRHEGGYVDHPKDPGGATNRGITIGTLRAYRGRPVTKAEVRALSEAEAKAIYKRNYWDAIKADDLPAGVDHALFDLCVNSGPGRARQFLKFVGADPRKSVMDICTARLTFLKGLPTWPTFGKGWRTRVLRVEQEALKMTLDTERARGPVDPPKPVQAPVAPVLPPPPPKPQSPWAWLVGALASILRKPARA